MNEKLFQKKQIAYPGVFIRLITVGIDLALISTLLSIPMRYISFYFLQINFADFISNNNIKLGNPEDINILVAHPEFIDYVMDSVKFFIYSAEIYSAQFILMSFYFIFCWTKFGTSFAKYIFKIKIMDYETGKNPTLRQSIIRYLSYVFFPISIFMAKFGKQKRALHDIFANTIVIKS